MIYYTAFFYEDTEPKNAACLDVNVTGVTRRYCVSKPLFFVLNSSVNAKTY
jgi:hypothetical protein